MGKKAIDLTNLKFGDLTVIRRAENRFSKFTGCRTGTYWHCVCVCGNTKAIRYDQLVKHKITHCGCKSKKNNLIHINQTYGFLTVVEKLGQIYYQDKKDTKIYWKCKCICGKILIKATNTIYRNMHRNQSCGCVSKSFDYNTGEYFKCDIGVAILNGIRNEAKKRNLEFNITLKDLWLQYIKQNKKCALTGIDLTIAKTFRQKPHTNSSLDRIDSSRGYTKDNIQWVYKPINTMKMDLSMKEFIRLCKLVTEKHSKYI